MVRMYVYEGGAVTWARGRFLPISLCLVPLARDNFLISEDNAYHRKVYLRLSNCYYCVAMRANSRKHCAEHIDPGGCYSSGLLSTTGLRRCSMSPHFTNFPLSVSSTSISHMAVFKHRLILNPGAS
jgi:hypothetical protein